MKNLKKNLLVAGLVLLAATSRLFPHAPNLTAVIAMSLFAGSIFGFSAAAFLVPVVAMLLTDLLFGAHATTLYVYGSLLLVSALGALTLKNRKAGAVAGMSFLSSLLFFLITNFGVWFEQSMYPKTTAGLVQCYMMGLPFLRNQILGDLMFSAGIFVSYELLVSAFVKKAPATKSFLTK